MNFRLKSTGATITRAQLAEMHPDKSLGQILTPEEYDEYGIDDVIETDMPVYDPLVEKVVGELVQVDGAWTRVWRTEALPQEQADANIAAHREQLKGAMGAYLAEVRTLREQLLNRLGGIGFRALATGNQATVDAVVSASQALLDITKAPAVTAAWTAYDLDALKAAVKAEYATIVGGVPPELVNAFDQVDA